MPHGVLRWTSPIGQVIIDVPEPAGPVFTDMPRTRARPPSRTSAERRRERRQVVEQMQADTRRRLDERALPPEQRTPPPEVDMTGHWATGDPAPSARPAPF